MASKEQAIRLLDIFLGCSATLFDHDPSAPRRKLKYGAAGSWRVTPYGCEYRTPSNWHLRSPLLTRLAFDIVNHAMTHMENGTAAEIISRVSEEEVQTAINKNDQDLAQKILREAKLPDSIFSRVITVYPTIPFEQAWGLRRMRA